ERRLHRRMLLARGEAALAGDKSPSPGTPRLVRAVAAVGRGIERSGLLPAKTLDELKQSLALAGLREGNALGLFIGAKILLLIACPVAAILLTHEVSLSPVIARLAPFFAGIIGLLLPDKVVSTLRDRYRASLERGVPDALDMMVICTQAGLGLVPAMQRVAGEIWYAHPAVARELTQTVNELQISVNSAEALSSLWQRTGLGSLKRVATTLTQSAQYGTPLSEALRGLAAELRQEALTRYEEKAARLPVMLTIPMIVFVLPCIFIVVGGPAVLHLGKAFSH
ncbi:MAG TPA: type II secretion system F family protein, partial [Acidisoma sp.]|nr:type II secretion system F family protein [Acidisoma sp.]